MSELSRSAAPARYNLPASLIFAPRELKLYRRWQISHTTHRPAQWGSIPTAAEYEDFQQWLKKQDSGYFSDVFEDISEHIHHPNSPPGPSVAALCRHTLHPVETDQPRLRCPVCVIDMHMNYMKVLTRSLHGANGRPLPRTGTPSEQQENLYLAWLQGKLATLRQVDELERHYSREIDWEKTHSSSLDADAYTAAKALDLYWLETTGYQSTHKKTKSKKTLAFAEDTNFRPGRPTDYFLRKSPRWEPGKYTLPEGEQDRDENASEDSEDYSDVRVIVLGGPKISHDLQNTEELGDSVQAGDLFDDLKWDDGDSDWEDIDSEDESDQGSYICFEEDSEDEAGDRSYVCFGGEYEGTDFIVFSND